MAEEQAGSLAEQDHASTTPEGSTEDAGDSPSDSHSGPHETIALILLSVTAILTAWCGFEASKWGGEMSIAFSQASSARIEAARQQGIANNARQADLTVYAVYIQAQATNDRRLVRLRREQIQQRIQGGLRRLGGRWHADQVAIRDARLRPSGHQRSGRSRSSEPIRCSPTRW